MNKKWQNINKMIEHCQKFQDIVEIIDCLETLYELHKDGMVAFALGQEHAKIFDDEQAIQYFEEARELFTSDYWKFEASTAIYDIYNPYEFMGSDVIDDTRIPLDIKMPFIEKQEEIIKSHKLGREQTKNIREQIIKRREKNK